MEHAWMQQIEKARKTWAALPEELRDLFDREMKQNLYGTHVGNPQTPENRHD